MAAIYNVVWDAATPGQGDSGISSYQIAFSQNGSWNYTSTGGTSMEIRLEEGYSIHVEVRAVGNNGLTGDPAYTDFTAAVNIPPPQNYPPSAPGNLRADFIRFE